MNKNNLPMRQGVGVIILNNQNNIDYEKYQVLNKNNERCFLIEKKND